MATEVSGVSVKTTITCTTALTSDLSTPKDPLSYSKEQTYTHGTGSGSINTSWHDTRTLTASGNETLDLSDLTDAFGETVNYSTLKELCIKNDGTTQLIVGGAAANALVACFNDSSDKITIPAGGKFEWNGGAAGVALGSNINLKIENDNTSTAGEYDIILLGVSA